MQQRSELTLNIKSKLQNAISYVKNICILGSDNSYQDIKKTGGWVSCQKYRYQVTGKYFKAPEHKLEKKDHGANLKFDEKKNCYTVATPKTGWFYRCDSYEKINNGAFIKLFYRFSGVNPLLDAKFHLNNDHKLLFSASLFVMASRQSNCGGMSCLLAKYLWENNAGIRRIEVVTTKTFDHCMVVVNRSGDLKDSDTWGDAWIADAWYGCHGMIFHAKEFKTKIAAIKHLAKVRLDKLAMIGDGSKEPFDEVKQVELQTWIEIDLEKDEYPTYSKIPFYPVEYYYEVENSYPKTELSGTGKNPLLNDFIKHKEKFQRCLGEICFFSSKGSSRLNLIGDVDQMRGMTKT